MIVRPKYYFNVDLKEEFLQGRKLNYIARELGVTPTYMSLILRGKQAIDDYVIGCIVMALGYQEKDIKSKKEKYFTLK